MGRFEPIIGEERDGCPVYKQTTSRELVIENRKRATSGEMLENTETLLYRWATKHSNTPFTRSGDEWLVTGGWQLDLAHFKACVGNESSRPPTTGWKVATETEFVADPSLICSAASTSPPCCLTVKLSGRAREAQGKCEGEYKSTGLLHLGRQVIL